MYPQFPERAADTQEILHFWGFFVLSLTVVSILAHIAISIIFNILFHITTKEKIPTFTDELDNLIDLKANRISFFVFILGFISAMGSLVFDQRLQLMFVILIISGFTSDVIGSISKLYYYRRGV